MVTNPDLQQESGSVRAMRVHNLKPWRYQEVPGDIAHSLKASALQIRTILTNRERDKREIGLMLSVARKQIPHGRWLAWVNHEFGMSDDQANRYITYAEHHDEIPPGAGFGIGVVSILFTSGAPAGAKEEALKMAEQGQRVTKDVASKLVLKHRLAEAREASPHTRRSLRHSPSFALPKRGTDAQRGSGTSSRTFEMPSSVPLSRDDARGMPMVTMDASSANWSDDPRVEVRGDTTDLLDNPDNQDPPTHPIQDALLRSTTGKDVSLMTAFPVLKQPAADIASYIRRYPGSTREADLTLLLEVVASVRAVLAEQENEIRSARCWLGELEREFGVASHQEAVDTLANHCP